jgi:uncharacterized protein
MNEVTVESAHAENVSFINRVYLWMFAGLSVTAITSFVVFNNQSLVNIFIGNQITFFILLLLELGAVIYLSKAISHISNTQAAVVFILYAILNGVTFSVIFLVYTLASIGTTFLITAGMFGGMSLYGYVTKKNLTSTGNIALMGLWGIILASLANMFLHNPRLDWVITYAGVLIFTALIAYDVQKIKNLNVIGNMSSDQDKKESIMGALSLYLDFINLFLKLLRIFGKRK